MIYEEKRDAVNNHITQAKTNYYQSKFTSSDQKATFNALNSLLRETPPTFPHDDSEKLCEEFSDFFASKIDGIIVNIEKRATPQCPDPVTNDQSPATAILEALRPVTKEELSKIISASPSKSCLLDVLPTWLLKKTLDVHLPILTTMVNVSLASSTVPSSAKAAVITPLIKKATLDPATKKNYRPVSNLTFLSKVIERVVLQRLTDHIENNNCDEALQSAYTKRHSTETALLKVMNDLGCHMDNNKAVLVVILDLSAAFDTIHHPTLISYLRYLGITGTALEWFISYISNRTQYVGMAGSTSSPKAIQYGVPQGSVLGPVLFSLYTRPLQDIITSYNISYHRYADDVQLYLQYDPSEPLSCESAVTLMQNCITEIGRWMSNNYLQLNEQKTEFLNVMSPRQLRAYGRLSLNIGGIDIIPSRCVKVLGVFIDEHLSMTDQVSSVVQTCNYHLRNIGKVRSFLTTDATKTAVQSLVVSRMDYCCALLPGLPEQQLRRLQLVQNRAARIVSRTPYRDHISPVILQLHWIPCRLRISFRILTYVYKCINGLAPLYLRDLLHIYTPRRTLRSAADPSTLVSKKAAKRVGERVFQNAAPDLWNKLPRTIRESPSVGSFKSALKTLYFSEYL